MHEELVIGQILLIGILVFTSFITGKIGLRIGLSETAGQIFGGVLVGPSFLKLVDLFVDKYDFLAVGDVSLATLHGTVLDGWTFYLPVYMGVVLFTLTEESHISRLREYGRFSLINSLTHTVFTFILVLGGLHFLLDLSLFTCVVLAAVASSSSPASALVSMTSRQVEGRLKSVWAQSTTLDVLVELILLVVILIFFAAETAFAKPDFKTFVYFASVTVAIGVGVFLLIKTVVQNRLICDEFSERTDNKKLVNLLASDTMPTVTILIIVWASIFLCVGASMVFHVPFTLSVIITGLLLSNYHSQYIFDSLKTPDLMRIFHLVFFALIGAHFDFHLFAELDNLKLIGCYILFRTLGKLAGTWLACLIFDKAGKMNRVLPMLFLPNMGSTGIVLLSAGVFLSNKGVSEAIITIIPAMLLFEIVGASLVDHALKKWKKAQAKKREEKQEVNGNTEQQELISFSQLLQGRVIIDIDVRTKDDAIKMMCAELLKHGNISELQNILGLVQEREQLCSTGMGDEVAIPHCRTSDVDYPMAVCAFVSEGESIDWDSLDGQGVRYIFLLISPLNDPNMHIEAMKTITTKIMQPGFLKEMYEKHKKELVES